MCVKPTIQEFKDFFARDFPFAKDPQAPDLSSEIANEDISRAQVEANCFFNDCLFDDEACCQTAYNYLTAHFLVENIRNSSQGLSGQYEGLITSKSVSSVSVGLSIPQSLQEEPTYSFLLKTTYGGKYLELIYPYLKGAVFTVRGATSP